MHQPAGGDFILQSMSHMILANNIGKALWSILAVKCLIHIALIILKHSRPLGKPNPFASGMKPPRAYGSTSLTIPSLARDARGIRHYFGGIRRRITRRYRFG